MTARRDRQRPTWEDRGDALDELRFHREMLEEQLRRDGLSADEAAREAARRLGDETELLAACRRIDRRLTRRERRSDVLSDLAADLALAWRGLLAAPAFALTAVATLALAIGATTALFSLVRGVLLQPLPYDDPGRLAQLTATHDERGWNDMPIPQGIFAELEDDGARSFELAVYRYHRVTLLSGEEPRRLAAAAISENLLSLLGVRPTLGRGFLPEDGTGAPGDPCLVSQRLWRTDLGSRRAAIGSVLRLEGDLTSCTVVGVLPSGIDFPLPHTDVWSLFRVDGDEDLWRSWFLRGLVRATGEAGIDGAQAELDALAEQWSDRLSEGEDWAFELTPLRDTVVGDVEAALWVLFGAVGLVLLIACANLGGLLLARTTERRQELALRSALGASRGRLARQLLAENLLLCGLGGGLGVLFAHVVVSLFRAHPPVDLPRLDGVGTDSSVLTFAFAVSLLAAVMSWLTPLGHALRAGLPRLAGSRGGDPGRTRLRNGLVILEAAMAVALLVGALLLARSFLSLTAVEPGFDLVGTAAARVELPPSRYPDAPARRAFWNELLQCTRSLPSVGAAGLTTGRPLQGVAMMDRLQFASDPLPEDERPQVTIDAVTPGYFEAIGLPVLAGRAFDHRDHAEAQPVAILNRELVRRHSPAAVGASPTAMVGRNIVATDDETSLVTVGVVGSLRQFGLRSDTPASYYIPFDQSPRGTAHLVLRTDGATAPLAEALRSIVRELDPALPAPTLEPLRDTLRNSVGRDRFYAWSMGGFALLAALLATLGLYGVVAFSVERRRRELGVRMALGARRSDVFRAVVGHGVLLGVAGAVLGTGSAMVLSRSLEGMLFGVDSTDPAAFLGAVLLVVVTAAAAASLPARRASRVDPARTLRAD